MSSCTACGHQLGVGRFCTNCGAPVDSLHARRHPGQHPASPSGRLAHRHRRAQRSSAAPRPTRAPRRPRSRRPRRPATRCSPTRSTAARRTARSPRPPPSPPRSRRSPPRDDSTGAGARRAYEPYDYVYDEERRSPVLLDPRGRAGAGAGHGRLVVPGPRRRLGPGRRRRRQRPSPPRRPETGGRTASTSPGGPRPRRRRPRRPTRTSTATRSPTTPATCSTASPRPRGGRPATRTGMELTFTLREPTELHQVGLINGYAKTSTDDQGRTFDWYLGNRRDRGRRLGLRRRAARSARSSPRPARCSSSTSTRRRPPAGSCSGWSQVIAPGRGPAARDFTAISEVSLVGDPTG